MKNSTIYNTVSNIGITFYKTKLTKLLNCLNDQFYLTLTYTEYDTSQVKLHNCLHKLFYANFRKISTEKVKETLKHEELHQLYDATMFYYHSLTQLTQVATCCYVYITM